MDRIRQLILNRVAQGVTKYLGGALLALGAQQATVDQVSNAAVALIGAILCAAIDVLIHRVLKDNEK